MLTEDEVWLRAWLAVASSDNCESKQTAQIWADDCLNRFRERFSQPVKAEAPSQQSYPCCEGVRRLTTPEGRLRAGWCPDHGLSVPT